nr:hypothetical protein [uncultured Halomonas sp.]
MKVTALEKGTRLVIELENQDEIVFLWAVAGSIAGTSDTPRRMFSDAISAEGLCEKLAPHVDNFSSRLRYGLNSNPPPKIGEVLEDVYGLKMKGRLSFAPTKGKQPPHASYAATKTATPDQPSCVVPFSRAAY